jgi:predicted alpha/beta superfamily hydrolase
LGIIENVHSTRLNENRVLNIYLPQDYHPDSSITYPVVYLLDASANEDFPHIAGLFQFMTMYELMPKSILVGIANVDRQRDFTSPSSVEEEKKKLPTSGGAKNFIGFIKDDLQPYIQKRFPTNGHNTIIGQSLGGLVTTQILFDEPQLFDQYIIVSPSLWWNKGELLNRAQEALGKHTTAGKKVYIAVGDEPEEMKTGAKKLEEAIEKYAAGKYLVYHEFFPHETHATILHRSVYSALEWLYPHEKKQP